MKINLSFDYVVYVGFCLCSEDWGFTRIGWYDGLCETCAIWAQSEAERMSDQRPQYDPYVSARDAACGVVHYN